MTGKEGGTAIRKAKCRLIETEPEGTFSEKKPFSFLLTLNHALIKTNCTHKTNCDLPNKNQCNSLDTFYLDGL